MISLIHPSRNRPEKAFRAFQEWKSKAKQPFEYILSIDLDEPQIAKYKELFFGELIIERLNKNVVQAMNSGALVATGDILVCMSDDFSCPDNWDEYILQHINPEKEELLLVNDGHKECIMAALPILTKKLHNRLGHVYHAETTGMFADNILAEYCQKHGLLKINREQIFLHEHWLYGHCEADSTNKRHDNPEGWKIGQAVIKRLREEGYAY